LWDLYRRVRRIVHDNYKFYHFACPFFLSSNEF
jgi:hypothetical protein